MPYDPRQGFSFQNYGGGWNPMAGGGGFSPYGGGMSMGYPGQQGGGGGGGWLGNALSTIGGGLMGANPLGLGIMGLGQLGMGLLGGLFSGGKQKKREEAFKNMQSQYNTQFARLFPEIDKDEFQYKNPAQNDAITGALAYRLGNMFGNWGMPEDMRGGYGGLNSLFSAMMPQQKQAQTQGIPAYGSGGIVTRPQVALVGERGPEAIVPLRQGQGGYGYMPMPGPGGYPRPRNPQKPGQGGFGYMPMPGPGGWYPRPQPPQRPDQGGLGYTPIPGGGPGIMPIPPGPQKYGDNNFGYRPMPGPPGINPPPRPPQRPDQGGYGYRPMPDNRFGVMPVPPAPQRPGDGGYGYMPPPQGPGIMPINPPQRPGDGGYGYKPIPPNTPPGISPVQPQLPDGPQGDWDLQKWQQWRLNTPLNIPPGAENPTLGINPPQRPGDGGFGYRPIPGGYMPPPPDMGAGIEPWLRQPNGGGWYGNSPFYPGAGMPPWARNDYRSMMRGFDPNYANIM